MSYSLGSDWTIELKNPDYLQILKIIAQYETSKVPVKYIQTEWSKKYKCQDNQDSSAFLNHFFLLATEYKWLIYHS